MLPLLHACLASDLRLVEPAPQLPLGWSVQGPSPRNLTLELHFAIKQQNLPQLHRLLLSVSSPSSDSYGEHLSNAAVHSLVAPTAEHLSLVRSYLSSSAGRVLNATPNGDVLRVTVSVAQAEALLGGRAAYMQLFHAETALTVHRMLEAYHVCQ